MRYSQDLFWSRLSITIHAEDIDKNIVDHCFSETEKFEKKYSRFIKWNYLYELNKNKSSQIDREFLSVINLCKKVSDITGWIFDITILPLLENIGYWIEKDKLEENIWYKNIEINWQKIILNNGASIDIWAVWKWYMVDKIYNILDTHFQSFIIDFWGDIRIKWKENIFLEDPNDDKKVIWSIELDDISIASSSATKRKTSIWHHLISAKEKQSQNDKIAVYVTHKLSSFSDIFSTALFVCPLEKSIEILNKIDWLEGLIIAKNGEIYKSRGFNCKLQSIWSKM